MLKTLFDFPARCTLHVARCTLHVARCDRCVAERRQVIAWGFNRRLAAVKRMKAAGRRHVAFPHAVAPRLSWKPAGNLGLKSEAIVCRRSATIENRKCQIAIPSGELNWPSWSCALLSIKEINSGQFLSRLYHGQNDWFDLKTRSHRAARFACLAGVIRSY